MHYIIIVITKMSAERVFSSPVMVQMNCQNTIVENDVVINFSCVCWIDKTVCCFYTVSK